MCTKPIHFPVLPYPCSTLVTSSQKIEKIVSLWKLWYVEGVTQYTLLFKQLYLEMLAAMSKWSISHHTRSSLGLSRAVCRCRVMEVLQLWFRRPRPFRSSSSSQMAGVGVGSSKLWIWAWVVANLKNLQLSHPAQVRGGARGALLWWKVFLLV